jgi:hypothetical protein
MPDHGLPYLANCSMLFTERPLLERPAAAKAAGFDAVEFWWPWPDQPVPGDADVDAFVRAVRDAGVQLVGLNFFAGDLAGPDCGVLSIPSRSQQFRDNIDVAVGIGEQLGVAAFNALYGNRVDDASPDEQDDLGRENLGHAAVAADRIGATVLVEPVSGPKPYPLRTANDAVAVPATRTSDSCATCSIWPITGTISTRRSRDIPTWSATSRSLIIPDEANPDPARSTSTGTWARLPSAATPAGSAWSTSRPRIPRRAWSGCLERAGPRRTGSPTSKEPAHDWDRLPRPGDHGQPDGRPSTERWASGRGLQQVARKGRAARRGRRAGSVVDSRRRQGR